MKKTKKILSGLLAVLMLVSMLACFALPAAALDGNQTVYYVTGRTQWREIVGLVNDDPNNFAGKTIYFMTDIDMGGGWPSQINEFAGTIDGNGFSFTNVASNKAGIQDNSKGVTIVQTLAGGTIKNLTFDSTCVFTATAAQHTGAFVAQSEGGTISNCAFLGTYNATSSASLGAFVGYAKSGTTTLEGCVFGGTLNGNTASGKYTGAFVGRQQSSTSTKVQLGYCVAKGTLSGSSTGMVATSTNGATNVKNSYTVGGINDYVGTTTKDFQKNDIKEAVWTINDARATAQKDGVYINVDTADVPYIGSANNRVVKGTTVNGTTTTTAYYAPRAIVDSSKDKESTQNYFTPATVSGKTPIVTGAEYIDGVVYIDHSDFTIEYVDEAVKLRSDLQAMVDAYNAMDQKRFSNWSNVTTWLTAAQGVLDNASATAAQLQEQITAEASVDAGYTKASSVANYPSIADYNTYKYVETITDYKVGTKDEWLAAVEISNYVSNPNAVNFSGAKIHMTADIDMEHTPMLPLCYSWIFDGNLDGHDYVFKNININVDNAYGPIGLIGTIGGKQASTIQNLGIASGDIKVSGWPRYKATYMGIEDTGNRVGGFVGKAYCQNTLIRKCWNGANLFVENIGAAAGIIADPRNYAIVDSCFNVGTMQKRVYGIMGYADNKGKLFNSMGGAAADGVLVDKARTNASDVAQNIVNISGVINTLKFDGFGSGTTKKKQQAVQDTYNEDYTEMNYAAAAWQVNKNYQQQSYGAGERIYFALNENGEVRFGKPDGSDQIYRIKLIGGDAIQYTYASAGHAITLDVGFDINYYACKDPAVTIKGNTLVFGEDIQTTNNTFTVYVSRNADRGNVVSDDEINSTDVLEAVYMVAGKKIKNLLTADVNSDYDVTIEDAYQIIRYVFYGSEKACFTPGKPAGREEGYLKVLTYNTKSFHYDPNENRSNGEAMCRYNAVLNELKEIDADIIGFQEMDRYNNDAKYNGTFVDQIEQVKTDLNKGLSKEEQYVANAFFVTVPNTTNREDGGYGHGILSKYPILESEGVHYAGKGQLNDETKMLDDSEGRGFAWYKLDINKDGEYNPEDDIIFYNCHFMQFHEAQILYMTNYMRENHPNDRIVCTGDMNVAAFRVKGSFVDNEYFTAINGGKYFNSFTRTNAHSGSLVDNIFISENVEYYKPLPHQTGLFTRMGVYDSDENLVDEEQDEKNYWSASDHLPVWTYIKK